MPDRPRTPLMQNLKQLREQRQLSQTELAQRASMPPSAVSHFESGRRKPRAASLVRLANALACSTDDLVFGPLPRRAATFAPHEWLRALVARMPMADFDLLLALARRLDPGPTPQARTQDTDLALLVAMTALHDIAAGSIHAPSRAQADIALAGINHALCGSSTEREALRAKMIGRLPSIEPGEFLASALKISKPAADVPTAASPPTE